MDSKILKRFWSKVNKHGSKVPYMDSCCWVWTAYTDAKGHGRIAISKEAVYAHRASWVIHNGDIPSSMHVLHKCDNTSCVNPKHLFVGTHQANMKDRDSKGRGVFVLGYGRVLTDIQVKVCKARHPLVTHSQLAECFGVSRPTISRAIARTA